MTMIPSAGLNPGNIEPVDVSPSFALKERFVLLKTAPGRYPPDRRQHIKCRTALLCLLCYVVYRGEYTPLCIHSA